MPTSTWVMVEVDLTQVEVILLLVRSPRLVPHQVIWCLRAIHP